MKITRLHDLILIFIFTSPFAAMAGTPGLIYKVGVAISDITGPSYGINFMGYGQLKQSGLGIHTRLHSRATLIEDISSGKKTVFVVTDLMSISQAVKIDVVNRLRKSYGDLFNDSNVMLTATHTHSAPGGFFGSSFYNIPIKGFNKTNYEVIVSGIVDSIVKASLDLEPVEIILNEAPLTDASINRSPMAYLANPDKTQYSDDTNKSMLQLKFRTQDGHFKGILNWFAVHGTSMSNQNRLVSADNKGYAAWLFEKTKSILPVSRSNFVASFANSDAGDSSPNIFAPQDPHTYKDFEKTALIGKRQFEKALSLFQTEGETLSGTLDYRHLWISMPGFEIKSASGEAVALCHGAYGFSFGAGAGLDGPSGVAGFYEGMRIDQPLDLPWTTKLEIELGKLFQLNGSGIDEPCHFPKRVLFPVGSSIPPTIVSVLPFQIFRIGSLAIVSTPGEMTTMSGRRLRNTVFNVLKKTGVSHVVISAYANTYSGYVTTPEEYQYQRYEGGANLFGPNTLLAYQEIYEDMSRQLLGEPGSLMSVERPNLEIQQVPNVFNIHKPMYFNSKRENEKFGDVLLQPKAMYHIGQTIDVSFRTAYNEDPSFMVNPIFEVQKLDGVKVSPVVADGDPETSLQWKKDGDELKAEFWWTPLPSTLPGTYRILHHGKWRDENSIVSNAPNKFDGISNTFQIQQ